MATRKLGNASENARRKKDGGIGKITVEQAEQAEMEFRTTGKLP